MYYILHGFLWLLSLLPLRILYVLSDGIYFLVFYVFKYRRDVVFKNLGLAFPEKPEKERRRIAKKFYHNLIDTFMESIKMVSASTSFIEKRVTGNWEVLQQAEDSGKSIQVHLGHNFNWEWANEIAATKTRLPLLAVYMPISNKAVDRLFYKLRSRSGNILLRANHMKEDFLPYRGKKYILGLAADQNPSWPPAALWFNFFGRPTPFLRGPAKNAIANDTIVIFVYIHKLKRGHYNGVFTLAEQNPKNTNEVELTERFVRYLEDVIKKYPEMWLWSHRRFRHEWKPEYGPVIS
jgi:Kdo2-lipid IVA lauroyltransferase/acyltransferase